MATTVSNSRLTVRVIEEIEINGQNRGNKNKHTISGINEITERIITIPTTQVTILSASNVVGAGTFVSSSIKYIRLTNLDDTNFVRLSMTSGSSAVSNTLDLKLEAQRSMIFTNTSMSGSSVGATFNSFSGFTNLKAIADTSSVDLEMFIASS